MTIGRPTKYNKSLLEKADKYSEIHEQLGDVIPSHTGLARYLGITTQTLYRWAKQKNKKDFCYTVERVNNLQLLRLINGGLTGKLNVSLVILLLHNYDHLDCW